IEHIKFKQLHKSMYRLSEEYRVLLNRVDTSVALDIEWPTSSAE
ncbi:TPA: tail fiber assembly protein, partial [Escherichia coli]|nr:tail fiber assembly protein [Escherichia coli]